MRFTIKQLLFAVTVIFAGSLSSAAEFQVKPITEEQSKKYTLDQTFYKKGRSFKNILIATSDKVPDVTHLEGAYLFDQLMKLARPDVAERVRERKVLCILLGHSEQVSELPQYKSDKMGKELDFYNWRSRGFLDMNKNGHPTVLFTEEDVMEYEGGMQLESILVHEFGHVIAGTGFDDALREKMTAAFQGAKAKGLYNDGYAAQKFRRVKSETPVLLFDELYKSFPDLDPAFLKACMDGGDILVNGKPCDSKVTVTKDDKVLIVLADPRKRTPSRIAANIGPRSFKIGSTRTARWTTTTITSTRAPNSKSTTRRCKTGRRSDGRHALEIHLAPRPRGKGSSSQLRSGQVTQGHEARPHRQSGPGLLRQVLEGLLGAVEGEA